MRWPLVITAALAVLAGGLALAQDQGSASHEATPEEAPPRGQTPPASATPQPTSPAATPQATPAAPSPQAAPAAPSPPPAAEEPPTADLPVRQAPAPQAEAPQKEPPPRPSRVRHPGPPVPPPFDCSYQQVLGVVVGMDDTTLWLKKGTTALPLRLTPATSLDGGMASPVPPTFAFQQGDIVRACFVARPLEGQGPVLNVAVAVDGPRSHEP